VLLSKPLEIKHDIVQYKDIYNGDILKIGQGM